MKKSAVDTEPIITELVTVIFQIESQLKIIQEAFNQNQVSGEKLRDKIKKIRSEGKDIPSKLDDNMNTVLCLREWHWNYIERFERFNYETKSIYLDFDKIENNPGFLGKSKRKKILEDAGNAVLLGRTYIETLGDVFDGNYLALIPGEEIRNEALKLMSTRLGAASKARGDDKLPWSRK
jgi:hypothetical protein